MMKPYVFCLLSLAVLCGCRTPQGPLGVSVEMTNRHPILIDHDRVLVATVGDEEIDRERLCSDRGSGSPLHYVRGGDTNTTVAVDANGIWYRVTRRGIKKTGWHWMKQLPDGVVHRIALDDSRRYKDTPVDNVDLKDVYKHKDALDWFRGK